MDEFLGVLPKFLGSDIMEKEQSNGRASRIKDDEKSIAKMEFKSALFRVKETKEELEQLHRISEEEVKRRGNMRRGESLESNASIPLPVPVRTRSARGGSESGYSSDTY